LAVRGRPRVERRLAGLDILIAASGSYFTVTSGVDAALTGQPNQRANQVLDDPFMPNRTFSQWLNPAAFRAPASGTYGTMPLDAIVGSREVERRRGVVAFVRPWQQPAGAVPVGGVQRVQHDEPEQSVSALNSADFGG
jgi:hypothetical protein